MAASVITLTALQSLSAIVGKDKVARHEFIVAQIAIIMALALCKQPPKGFGTPADHARIAGLFSEAKMTNYAEHSAAIPVALKGRFRSIDSWAEAMDEGTNIAVMAFQGCAPKVYSPEEIAKREAKREEAKKAKAKAAKADAKAAKELRAAELADAERAGRESVVTAQVVADLIRAGAFSLQDVAGLLGAVVVPAASVVNAPGAVAVTA